MMSHRTRRNSSGHSINTNNAHKKGISLGETLEAGRKAAPLENREEHSISISSGYTADPTDFTERSRSSSVCLSETGQVIVSTRIHSPKYSRKIPPSILPPPPFTEDEAEVQEVPRKPKSCRRRSMFGSTAPDIPIAKPYPDKLLSSPKIVKPRRRSVFGSGTSTDFDLPQQPKSDINLNNAMSNDTDADEGTIELSPTRSKSSFHNATLNSSSHFFDTEIREDKNKDKSTTCNKSNRGKKLVKAFLFSPHRKKKNNKSRGPNGSSGGNDEISIPQDKEEREVHAQTKAPRSHRRHSLFGSADIETKKTQEGTAQGSKPPLTPNRTRRHRRSLLGTFGGATQEDVDSRAHSRATDSPRSEKSSMHLLRGSRSEAVTASLTPRTNNPYELVNNERIKRHLPPFVRSMLLDSVAKDVAMQLSRSNGANCRPTDYYGNIGKGVDIWTIHNKMMAQKGTEKANIISSYFYQCGIGLARDREGQIYLCQLFQ
jgi:hypothetical protein